MFCYILFVFLGADIDKSGSVADIHWMKDQSPPLKAMRDDRIDALGPLVDSMPFLNDNKFGLPL